MMYFHYIQIGGTQNDSHIKTCKIKVHRKSVTNKVGTTLLTLQEIMHEIHEHLSKRSPFA